MQLVFWIIFIIEPCQTSFSNLCQYTLLYCKKVWPIIHLFSIPSSLSAPYIPWIIVLQDRLPKSYWWWVHALLRSTNSPSFLNIGCEPYLAHCNTALLCLLCILINNFQFSLLVPYYRFSHSFPLSAIMPSNLTGSTSDANVSGNAVVYHCRPASAKSPYSQRHISAYQNPSSITSHRWERHTNPS